MHPHPDDWPTQVNTTIICSEWGGRRRDEWRWQGMELGGKVHSLMVMSACASPHKPRKGLGINWPADIDSWIILGIPFVSYTEPYRIVWSLISLWPCVCTRDSFIRAVLMMIMRFKLFMFTKVLQNENFICVCLSAAVECTPRNAFLPSVTQPSTSLHGPWLIDSQQLWWRDNSRNETCQRTC